MHTHKGTRWQAQGTELDELWFPNVEYAGRYGGSVLSLLIDGSPAARSESAEERFYLLTFLDVQVAASYSETVYWMLAEEEDRPGSNFSKIVNSGMLPKIEPLMGGSFGHFLVSGSDVCCEIVADENYRLQRFASRSDARAVLEREITQ